MKRPFSKKKIAVLTAISSLVLLSGCGAAPNNTGAVAGAVIPGTNLGAFPGGCIPLGQASSIPFVGLNAVYANNYLLKGGTLPVDQFSFQYQPEQIGQVTLANGYGAPINTTSVPGYGSGGTFAGQSQWSGVQVQMYVQPTGPMYGGSYSGPVNVTGQINLGPIQGYLASMANNNYYSMSGFPYPAALPGYSPYQQTPQYQYPYPQQGYTVGQYPQLQQQTCISSVAFRLERLAGTGGYLGKGAIWLYLNGQQRGISLAF
jgi:hypothetical protein